MIELLTAWLLLFMGDFLSTFCYHVPEHVFGRLHLQSHHAARKTFRHYAVLSLHRSVLLDGILGALPYILLGAAFWAVSPTGVLVGWALGQCHVWWRHTGALGWETPHWGKSLCQMLYITTPEQHWLHHRKTTIGYGDIFTVFDQPARSWLSLLRLLRLRGAKEIALQSQ
ncbi:MAG: sterol desaturase [Thermosynechococcaceae cyanobacterium MS004]|nr:sterol desaturase [Thermosynechococcaceae cyanobacterium MS004]